MTIHDNPFLNLSIKRSTKVLKPGNYLGFDCEIEGLRGLLALAVMFVHGFGMQILDTSYRVKGLIPYLGIGSLAVHAFFMLSGYAIGISALRKTSFNAAEFYKRRIIRLYPIYVIVFTLLIIIGSTSTLLQLIGNVFILQNENPIFGLKIPVEKHLLPIWSLNYEVLYYLIFPVILIRKLNLLAILFLLAIFLIIGCSFNTFPAFFSDYLIGYLFWFIGLIIGWRLPNNKNDSFRFLSYVLLLLAYNHFAIGTVILKGLNLYNESNHSFGLEALFNIPICSLIIIDLSKRSFIYKNIILIISYLLPLLLIIYLAVHNRLFEDMRWIASTIFYFLSILFYVEKKYSTIILKNLSFFGGISYAIYITHFPMMYIVNKYYPSCGNGFAYSQKLLVWVILTFSIAYLLEKIIQPKIKSYFLKNAR